MKKVIVLLGMLFLMSGCVNINDLTVKDIIDKTTTIDVDMANQYRSGYKYYLPRSLKIVDKKDYNEIAKSGNYNYYIYVDIISYYNKIELEYEVNQDSYFSYAINQDGKLGYVVITDLKDKYFLEIMYNYAKIEVIVEKIDVNIAISNAIGVLSTIKYNDTIIDNLVGDNVLKFSEMEFDIFEAKQNVESNYLQSLDENVWDEEGSNQDPDLIN